jgi:hypothetical protein
MTSLTISPSIDQAAALAFQSNFHRLAQQTNSKLASSPAVRYQSSDSKTVNVGRMGSISLVEAYGRNPNKEYVDYNVDNRQFTKRRFTATVLIDKKTDINELITDPTSDIMQSILSAKERVIDRVIADAALGAVLTGAPDASPTSTSAATDGVITVDATGGLTYAKIQEITQNFINNEMTMDIIKGANFLLSGTENSALMQEVEFINNDYISGYAVEEGYKSKAGIYMINMFAGSVTGGLTVSNPILTESSTTRNCMVLAPNAVSVAMELARLDVQPSGPKVNSNEITIDLWIGAARNEGALVQKVTTTF